MPHTSGQLSRIEAIRFAAVSVAVSAALDAQRVCDVQEIITRVDQCESAAEICRETGLRFPQLYNFARRKCGVAPQRTYRHITAEIENAIKLDLKEGKLNHRQIALKHNVSKGSVGSRSLRLQREEMRLASREVIYRPIPHKCQEHGTVAFLPCPICVAQGKS